jgi:lysylphosphatidylglycerol synthetase-like protein (DUF2156 family)
VRDERSAEVTERVRQFGGALSHALLDPSCRGFETDGVEGVVAFDVVGKCAVVFGDPICANAQREALEAAFEAYCREHGWSTIVVATTTPNGHHRAASVTFGDLLFADPRHDPESGHAGRHLRQNLARTRRGGVVVSEYVGERDEDLEARAQAACDAWRTAGGTAMFITTPRLFTERLGRRWFVARRGDEVVGLLSLLRAGGVGGHLVNLVFAAPGAPSHTADLLVASAMRVIRAEGAESICFGIGPRPATELELDGLRRASVSLAKHVYRIGDRLVHFHSKTTFWEKFGPLRRVPLFIRFEPPHLGVRECRALFRAFHFSLG